MPAEDVFATPSGARLCYSQSPAAPLWAEDGDAAPQHEM